MKSWIQVRVQKARETMRKEASNFGWSGNREISEGALCILQQCSVQVEGIQKLV